MKKAVLWLEFLTLFGVIPFLYFLGLIPLPKIPLLLAFFTCCLIYLKHNENLSIRDLWSNGLGNSQDIKWICIRAGLVGIASLGIVMATNPAFLFSFPRSRPLLWVMVMILYPLLSAFPQEVIYRAFLFKRYTPILTRQNLIIASVVAFSFLHIIFDNWIAIGLTLPAGFIFTRVYLRTRSLFLASLEHGLYGCIIFPTGLGRFSYPP